MQCALAARNADPQWRARLSESMKTVQNDPDVRAAQAKSRRADRNGYRRLQRVAKRQMAAINADPVLVAKRIAAMKASRPKMREKLARKLAERYGFPVQHVDAFRQIRNGREMSAAEVVAVLRSSYPADFVAIDDASARAARRAAGPQPAPGTAASRAWSRRIAEARP